MELERIAVPSLVGQPVDVAQELAATVGVVLESDDPDGPGLRSRTWPGLFWVTAQAPVAGTLMDRGGAVRIRFVREGDGGGDATARVGGPRVPPPLRSAADVPSERTQSDRDEPRS